MTAVRGDFSDGDVLELLDSTGTVRARGVTSYDAEDVVKMIGRSTADLPPDLQRPIIHADDLVRT